MGEPHLQFIHAETGLIFKMKTKIKDTCMIFSIYYRLLSVKSTMLCCVWQKRSNSIVILQSSSLQTAYSYEVKRKEFVMLYTCITVNLSV